MVSMPLPRYTYLLKVLTTVFMIVQEMKDHSSCLVITIITSRNQQFLDITVIYIKLVHWVVCSVKIQNRPREVYNLYVIPLHD